MPIEIERKFLTKDSVHDILALHKGAHIKQSYIDTNPEKTIRARIYRNKAYLTLKGRGTGLVRPEYEYEIPVQEADEMMTLFGGPIIDKIRTRIPYGDHIWEVDVFAGANEGLILAEIELTHEDEAFARPEWIGEEVSNDQRYFNSALQGHPYRDW